MNSGINKNVLKHLKIIIIILLCLNKFPVLAQYYNGSQIDFGKNRVQYNDFFWTYYKFDKFDIYFYLNGKNLAIYTAKYANSALKECERKLNVKLEDKIQFIVYNNLTDLKQSNIGLEVDAHYNIGGITHIIGNKIFLYFNGDHNDFERQIRSGIYELTVNQILYGSSMGSKIKNTNLIIFPDWYKKGLISFLSEDWNNDIDNNVKDGILSGRYKKINKLTGKDALYAGHSLWKYIGDIYGVSTVVNIIDIIKANRNIKDGFLLVLNVPYKTLINNWYKYYYDKYSENGNYSDVSSDNFVLKKFNKNKIYSQLKYNPKGEYLAYTTNESGQYKIYIYNVNTKKRKKIFKSGYKLEEKNDLSYPILAWHPSGQILSFIIEDKGKIFLCFYNPKTKKIDKRYLYQFEKILDFSYSDDAKYFVISAVKKGKSDIFIYDIAANSYEQITNDIFDDLNPRFINNSKNIVFSSNRGNKLLLSDNKDSIINITKFKDIYLYDFAEKKNTLKKITNTPFVNETMPQKYDDDNITYLADNNGIYNRYIAHFDSTISFIDTTIHYRYFTKSWAVTNYSRNILEQNITPSVSKITEIIFNNGKYNMYAYDLPLVNNLSKTNLETTNFGTNFIKKPKQIINERISTIDTDTNNKKIFITDADSIIPKISRKKKKRFSNVWTKEKIHKIKTFADKKINSTISKKPHFFKLVKTKKNKSLYQSQKRPLKFILPKKLNYDVEYSINEMLTQMDFAFLNYSYQHFTGGKTPIYLSPGFSGFFKIGISDLLEDYRITGGIKLSSDLKNNEYVLSYSNYKKRLNKEYVYHRKIMQENQEYSIIKHISNEFYYILKWPFSQVSCIKGSVTVRDERLSYLSTDPYNLLIPDKHEYWTGVKTEYIFDNTSSPALNIYYGTRYKLWFEYYQTIEKTNKNLFVLGFDFRNYQKIHRTFIWANRFATSTSFGKNKLIYYLGGVDNWINPKFNRNIEVDYSKNYTYQSLATNLRGFKQNIRNGTSFFVINSELRFPIFKYFANRPIKSDFFNNFQIVGFADVGSAWNGFNPYSEENIWNTKYIYQGPVRIKIQTQKSPLVAGYGFGLRTRLLGYFVRADWAWGIEENKKPESRFYISLSLDF